MNSIASSRVCNSSNCVVVSKKIFAVNFRQLCTKIVFSEIQLIFITEYAGFSDKML